jgi:centrosomal CEP192-like protein/beta-propeller repeat-containing protein
LFSKKHLELEQALVHFPACAFERGVQWSPSLPTIDLGCRQILASFTECVMSRKLPALFVACIAAFAAFAALGPSPRSNPPSSSVISAGHGTNFAATQARLLSSYGKLPLTFEQNLGQSDSRVRFLAHGEGYALFLTGQETVLHLDATIAGETRGATATPAGLAKASRPVQRFSSVVRLTLAGSNPHSLVEGLDLQPGRSNYFIGNDPAKWRTGVPNFARVKYSSVYPGIDLIYYGNQGHLESDFALAPGADPSQIALRIEGADKLRFDSQAGLLLSTKSGDVVLHRPVAYQEAAGLRQEIAANYVERGNGVVGIQLGPYDSRRPLIIDPVLVYSTYLGGSLNDRGLAIAADSSGNAYVTGTTSSLDFPQMGAIQTFGAPTSAFVTMMNPTGTALLFSTFLGGAGTTNGTSGEGIALDGASPPNIYVAGTTDSATFPVMNAFQSNKSGTSSNAFMAKLAPMGSSILYATYIGGTGTDACHAIAVDKSIGNPPFSGNAYITGDTTSTDYPITAGTAMQVSNTAGTTAFVSRFDPALSGLASRVYSTYLGGTVTGHKDTGAGIAVDASGHAFVAGETNSATFPVTTSAFQSAMKGTAGNSFLAEIDTTTSTALPVYSSFLGGTATAEGESALGISLDASFNAYIAGSAATIDFPTTPGAFQKTINTNLPAYVARFDTTKSGAASLVYSTYLAGSGTQFARSIAVDPAGDAFVVGETSSNDFPVTPGASQSNSGGGLADAFLTELNPSGSALLFSTYHGGVGTDTAFGVALDSASPHGVYLTGFTNSATTFPVVPNPGAFQTKSNSPLGGNAFVSKITPASAAAVFASPSAINFGTVNLNTASPSQAVTLVNNSSSAVTSIVITFTGLNPTDFSQTDTCGTSLAANSTCTINVVYTPAVSGAESATLNIADNASSSPQTVALSGTGSASAQPDFSLSVSPSPLSVTAGGSGNFTVTVNSLNNFSAAVVLSCSGAPQNSTCTLLPNSVTPPGGGTQTSAGTITTHAMIPPSLPSFPRLRPLGVLGILALLLALLLARAAARRGARKLAWGFALLGVLALAGCSGIPGGAGGGGNGSTPKGTTTITITGTSGALSHTTTFSFTVN